MTRFPALGVRLRLVATLVAGAGLAVVLLAAGLRPLIDASFSRHRGERLLATARALALGAPADPARLPDWLNGIDTALTDEHVVFVATPPGRTGFEDECASRGLSAGEVVAALDLGQARAIAPNPDPSGDDEIRILDRRPPGTWAALVRIDGPRGPTGVLALVERSEGSAEAASVWGLWLLATTLAFVLSLAGAYLFGWFLLVRPIAATAAAARRVFKAGDPDLRSDLEALRTSIPVLGNRLREVQALSGRQAAELDRIRSDLSGAQATLLRTEKLASVGQLAAGIAHEIGNPIGIVLGMSELLKDGAVAPEDQARFAGQIHASSLRVHGILKDLLTFARPIRDEGASTDVAAIVDATTKLLEPQKRFREVALEVRMPDEPVAADIKPSQLQQILVNLLLNAADAMGGKGRIRVIVEADERWVRIRVEDEGPGIPEADLGRVFDPFYSTKPPGEGTGLGLAICAQIAEVYGGGISIESVEGRGTTLTIRLWRA